MPYTPTSKNLPAHVKKLPAKQRRQWTHVWNSVYEDTGDEKKAFMSANGVVKSEKAVKVYTDHNDPELPDDVKALPSTLKRRYVANHNYHVMDNGDPEAAHQYAIDNTYMSLSEGLAMSGKKLKAAAKKPVASDEDEDESAAAEEPDDVEQDDNDEKKRRGKKEVRIVPNAAPAKSLLAWFKELVVPGAAPSATHPVSPWLFYKDNDNRLRGLVVYSNVFKDKHKEIIPEAAHKEYVSWADAHGAYPEMHLWHGGPGTRWGQVDFVDYTDGFAVAGFVVDAGKEFIAEAIEKEKSKTAVSHGFYGLKQTDNTYLIYRPFEISPLPVTKEANAWTAISFASKEYQVAFSDAKKGYFKKLGLDDAAISDAEGKLKSMGEALKASGVEFKELDDPTTEVQPIAVLVTEFANLAKSVGDLATAVSAQSKELGEVKTQVTAFQVESKKSVDERVNDQLTARVAAAVGGHKASESADSAVTKEAAAAAGVKSEAGGLDWLYNDILTQQLAGVGQVSAPKSS